MARVLPLRGIRYNADLIEDFSSVVAPPYDIIPPEEKARLHAQSPHNIIHIDFGGDRPGDDEKENRYSRAALWLNEWLSSRILIRDDRPCFYGYEVEYTLRGQTLVFRGLLALVGLEPFSSGVVLPHEETHSKPKTDRLYLMRATGANTSPIFSLYDSPRRITSGILEELSKQPGLMTATDPQGAVHRLWKIEDAARIEAITRELAPLKVFIADGHHRYETALHYMTERPDGRADHVLMFLANMEEPGLSILPTHRLIHVDRERLFSRLREACRLEPLPDRPAPEAFLPLMKGHDGHCFGLYAGADKGFLVHVDRNVFRDVSGALGRLDVTVLHRYLMEQTLGVTDFAYEMDPAVAARFVDEGRYDAAIFLNPTPLASLRDVALAGHRMPPKSTYFYPKLLTGMLLNRLD